jgi:pimeloyl-ACP methyl ester carboxylesterase
MNRADVWRDKGNYFSWSPRRVDAAEVQVFHVELGDAGAPPLVLVHGFPTSSIDWFEVAERLSDRHRVCAMDFPGYGFSDKPLGWGYSLMRDAEVLEYYVAEVLGLESMIMLAHDRGSRVAMIHTTSGESRVNLEHLFITNGNIFLPLSNLTQAQHVMLDPKTGPAALPQGTPEQLAVGMGQATYTPPRGADDPEIEALTAIFSHGEGVKVLRETIQYLVRAIAGRGLLAEGARRVRGSDDVHLGRLRHGLAAPGRELPLERVHDEEAGQELAVFHPGRKPLPAERPARGARRDIRPRARGAGRHRTRGDRAAAGVAAAGGPLAIGTAASRPTS